jgi:hypothetical protein
MSNLPYTTQPKEPTIVEVGTVETGILQMLSFGYIREKEQRELESIDFKNAKAQTIFYDMAKNMASQEGITLQDSLQIIEKEVDPTALLLKYGNISVDELQEIQSAGSRSKSERLTVIIRNRCWHPETSKTLEDWTDEDTENFLPTASTKLIEQIEDFFRNERAGNSEKKFSPRKNKQSN